ncbi:hypothetical protein SRB17_41370 [Streptomyces sp. RB17]|uniref:hypothetical protein n=1 Tax=Streptomyces sp. RB17 TaxID=2585197 RepID=UPI001294C7DD|nr:hypothetical protein [Streptomyces sp. RB17]MQY36140.1 hypothetical protein [Streptomyces sp. RB17]
MILAQPAGGTAGARIRQAVRAPVLVAVLLGLFLMHGGPTAAADGCHGAMPATDTTVRHSAPAPMAEHADEMRPAPAPVAAHADTMRPAPARTAERTSTMRPAPARTAAHSAPGRPMAAAAEAVPRVDESMRGALCLATAPRSEIPPPPIAAVGLVFPAVVLLPWARPGSDGTRRRGPPAGGRRLLLQVCIART